VVGLTTVDATKAWPAYDGMGAGCALLPDWCPATTGERVHVDGGYHALGA
jgi:hypothetical protein